jgi:hypothetical protein
MPPTLLWMLLLMATDTPSPTPPAPSTTSAPCAGAAYRQFDFWLGEWNVFGPKGRQVGRSHIEAVLGGCVIAEHWTSGSGPASDGRSLNQYQVGTGQWEQYWVDAQGGRLLLRGGLQGASMVLASEDGPARQRITWTPNADGSVRQLWESSSDAGATWTVAFDGLYRRVPAG